MKNSQTVEHDLAKRINSNINFERLKYLNGKHFIGHNFVNGKNQIWNNFLYSPLSWTPSDVGISKMKKLAFGTFAGGIWSCYIERYVFRK